MIPWFVAAWLQSLPLSSLWLSPCMSFPVPISTHIGCGLFFWSFLELYLQRPYFQIRPHSKILVDIHFWDTTHSSSSGNSIPKITQLCGAKNLIKNSIYLIPTLVYKNFRDNLRRFQSCMVAFAWDLGFILAGRKWSQRNNLLQLMWLHLRFLSW